MEAVRARGVRCARRCAHACRTRRARFRAPAAASAGCARCSTLRESRGAQRRRALRASTWRRAVEAHRRVGRRGDDGAAADARGRDATTRSSSTPSRHVRRIAGEGPGGAALSPLALHRACTCCRRGCSTSWPAGPRGHQPRRLPADDRGGAHRLRPHRAWAAPVLERPRHAGALRSPPTRTCSSARCGKLTALALVGPPEGRGQLLGAPHRAAARRRRSPARPGFGERRGGGAAGVRIGAAVSVGRGAKVGAGASLNRVAVLDGRAGARRCALRRRDHRARRSGVAGQAPRLASAPQLPRRLRAPRVAAARRHPPPRAGGRLDAGVAHRLAGEGAPAEAPAGLGHLAPPHLRHRRAALPVRRPPPHPRRALHPAGRRGAPRPAGPQAPPVARAASRHRPAPAGPRRLTHNLALHRALAVAEPVCPRCAEALTRPASHHPHSTPTTRSGHHLAVASPRFAGLFFLFFFVG